MGINIITWFNEEKRCFDQWTWEFDEWTLDWYSLSIMWSPNLLVSWWSVLDPSHAKHWEFVFLRTDKNQHFDQNMAIWFFFWCFKPKARQDHPGTREVEVYGGPVLICDRCASGAVPEVPYGAMCYAERIFFGSSWWIWYVRCQIPWGIRMKQQNVSICWEDPVKQLIG